uniref:Uncharacterized protein n=1 Tax=Oryza meridionalis TaxID=40149 RepID=A0A0E0DP39_9ORYZ
MADLMELEAWLSAPNILTLRPCKGKWLCRRAGTMLAPVPLALTEITSTLTALALRQRPIIVFDMD